MDKKKIDLTLFVVSFGALIVLLLTRLSFVMEYAFAKKSTTQRSDGKGFNAESPFYNGHEAHPDAQILGALIIALSIAAIIFLIRVLKSS